MSMSVYLSVGLSPTLMSNLHLAEGATVSQQPLVRGRSLLSWSMMHLFVIITLL